jgi:hypothetical protein
MTKGPNTPPAMFRASRATAGDKLECAELSNYGHLQDKEGKKYNRDHVPSYASLLLAAKNLAKNQGKRLTKNRKKCIKKGAAAITIPIPWHRKISRTYGGRNKKAQIKKDAGNLSKAASNDIDKITKGVTKKADQKCLAEYKKSAKKIKSKTNADYKKFLKSCLNCG